MSQFTENIWISPIPKTGKWTTTKCVRFYIYELWIWDYIDIPAWFTFNGCSIPLCIFWPKISPKTINPCCLHDYLFEKKIYWFHFSNFLFYKALRINKVCLVKSVLYLVGVSCFWWISYYDIVDRISVIVKERLWLSEKIASKIK